MYNLLVIVTMWNKVNELSRQSYSQAQIAQLLGVHRDTVRRYQSMSEGRLHIFFGIHTANVIQLADRIEQRAQLTAA